MESKNLHYTSGLIRAVNDEICTQGTEREKEEREWGGKIISRTRCWPAGVSPRGLCRNFHNEHIRRRVPASVDRRRWSSTQFASCDRQSSHARSQRSAALDRFLFVVVASKNSYDITLIISRYRYFVPPLIEFSYAPFDAKANDDSMMLSHGLVLVTKPLLKRSLLFSE